MEFILGGRERKETHREQDNPQQAAFAEPPTSFKIFLYDDKDSFKPVLM